MASEIKKHVRLLGWTGHAPESAKGKKCPMPKCGKKLKDVPPIDMTGFPTTAVIGFEFARVLFEWAQQPSPSNESPYRGLTPTKLWAKMCAVNAADHEANAEQDWCDANMAMDEAMRRLGLGAAYNIHHNTWTPQNDKTDLCADIMNLLRLQVRAVCIALEAEAATAEVIRAPHRLNQKRERHGKLPLYDYHVVSLANRKKYLPREPLPGDIEDDVHPGKRLHFVRGHWRHYTNSKVWVKWHFRGNPDLGFVDKEYRL